MIQIDDIYKFTEYWKKRYPQVYRGKSDEEIVNLVRERYPDKGFPTYEEALQTNQSVYAPEAPKHPKESLLSENTDPQSINDFYLTSDFIPQKWMDEGALGGLVSRDFFRSAYNSSIAGYAYKSMKGEDKYIVDEEYDPAWYAQAGQFLVGMSSPLDIATMIATGGLGKVAGLAGKAGLFGGPIGKKYIEKGLLTNFALRNPKLGVAGAKAIDAALSQGIGGAGFMASHAMVAETARQREESPDKPINISKAMKIAADEMLHTLPMFAVAGGVTEGLMGTIYGYSTALAGKSPTYSQKLIQATTNPLARVGTESTLFTAIPSVIGDEDAPKLGSNEFWSALGTNAVVVASMRGVGKLVEPRVVTKDGKKITMEAIDVINSEMKLSSSADDKLAKSLKNVETNLNEGGIAIPKDTKDILFEYQRNTTEQKKTKAQIKKDYEFIERFNSKVDNEPKFLEKVAIKDSPENIEAAQYMKLVNDHSTFANGINETILTKEGRAAEIYKDITKKEPNEAELLSFTKSLENARDNVITRQKDVDDYLTGNHAQSKDGINGGKNTLKTPKKPAEKTKQSEIDKYVDLIAGEKGVLPSEVIKEPKYKKDILIKGESELSLRKLKEAYKSEIEKRPGTPSTELTKVLTDLDVSKSSELPVFSKKIARTKPIKDYISELKLDKTNEKMLYQGIVEFMQTRKSSNNPSNYKIIADYAKWLESKGKNLSEANRSLTDLYVTEQNVVGRLTTKNQRSQLNNTLSAFYGTGGVGKQPLDTGFAYKYMGTKEKTPAVSQLGVDRGGTIARPERIALVEPKDYGLIRAKNKQLIDEGVPLKGAGKQTVDPLTYDVATELLYNFGARKVDSLNRLFIENIDIKNGTIMEWSTGVGQKGAAGPRLDVPIKKMLPELWEKIVKVIGDRKSGNLLLGLDGKNLKGASVNAINKAIMPKGVNLRGKKGKLTTGDYRKMAMTDAFNIGGDKLREFVKLNLIGHVSGITQRYTKQSYESNWKKFIDGRKALDKTKTPPVKEKRTKRISSEVVFKKSDQVARDKFVAKVMQKNKLTKEQLKIEKLDPKVLGEFAEGTIKLQKGIFQPSDFYHENLHRLKAFARASKNKSLEKLIARGEKLAVNTKEYKAWKKKNVNRDVEEFLADIAGGKASRMQFSQGMLPKISQFVKQLVSRIKIAFGAGNFKDISNVLAKRVKEGFSTEGVKFAKEQVKFSMEGMTSKQAVAAARRRMGEFFTEEDLQKGGRKRIEKYIGDIAQLGDDFKLSNADPIQIQEFMTTLQTMDANVLKRLPDKLGWFKAFGDVEKIRTIKNITKEVRTEMLKDLGVVDGNPYKASAKQLRDFNQIINTLEDVKSSTTAWIEQRVAAGKVDRKIAEKWLTISKGRAVLPVATIIEYIGLKDTAQKLYNHASSQLEYYGKYVTFEDNMKRLFKPKTWDKVKEYGFLFDKERYFERLEKGYLTNDQKKFMNRAFEINVDKKTMKIKPSTKEGKFAEAHIELMKTYKDDFVGEDGALRQVLNPAQVEKYIDDKNIEYLNPKKNIYVHRRLTKEAKKYLNPEGAYYEKVLKEQSDAIAKNMAKHYYEKQVKKNYTKEQLEKKTAELHDEAVTLAKADLADLNSGYNPSKYSPNFYKKRHVKLDEKFKADGKLFETYETSHQATVKDYALGQAKFLANIEYFPEFVRLKGFNIPGSKEILRQLKSSDEGMGRYVEKALYEHLGINKAPSDYPNVMRFMGQTASFMTKMQLSSPTSGLKNFLVGNVQTMLAMDTKDFLLGLKDIIHKDNRAMVRATGATEVGMRSFELKGVTGRVDKILDKTFFRAGGMRFTEDLNRYISVLAGKRDQLALSRILKYNKEGSFRHNGAIRKLKEFYKLSNEEITLLKEFGMGGVSGLDVKTARLNKRKLDKLYQKMNTFAHINTQGAAINLFMPDWSRGQGAQAALLYKRMAYAATVNTTRNFKIAVQNGSVFQIAAFGLGTYYSGEALINIYSNMFGQEMPKENSSQFQKLKTTMWKGEFLGILSELLSPYSRNQNPLESMYPAILSTGAVMWNSVVSTIKGKTFVSQGFNDIARGSTGLYNAAYKTYNQGLKAKDSYASQTKRFRALNRDRIKEINDKKELVGLNETEMLFKMNKYMRAFREMFESGRNKDVLGNSVGKWYMMSLFAKANDYYYTKFDEKGNAITTPQEAMKAAVTSMKRTVTNLNPNPYPVNAKNKKARIGQAKKQYLWYDWLDRNTKEGEKKLSQQLKDLDALYEYRKRILAKTAKEYINGANLKKDLEYYGIPIGKLF